jgi:hypothetical protein
MISCRQQTTEKRRGRPPIGRHAMTNAQYCQRYRKAKRKRLKAAQYAPSLERRQQSRSAPPLPDGMQYRVGRAQEVMSDIASDSAAMVLTDLPYGKDSGPLYEWLAEFAQRVLVPGGSLLAYTGKATLGRDMAILGNRLRYYWLLTVVFREPPKRLRCNFLWAGSRPVLWYTKGERRRRATEPYRVSVHSIG